ncbi:NAD(P)H-quinone oxidoreductase [Sediminibacillus halophilus]|uniref:Putative NAD(P)H quinone oxidoreductase, PIG3 family n=1 Tax=Sediminibacillus halophilus TaxID=482461 RepID=A0A1G9NNS8_9BACI|nr:NAD(P)H-quinone oxidoreductase [Sediminibacillus halophilus]SDL88242.1 putative NAD(P)H quinone oxidoreductase, PIG3 family [Sediminibacillus halophilus]
MRVITVKQPGGAEQLQLSERPKPELKSGELLIKVKAAAINRTDIINRQTSSGYLDFDVLGIEVAGIVESAGNDTGIKPGTKVMGLVNGGGYAEYAVMPADRAMIIPDNLSFEEAAAIPEVFLTAYQTLFWLGELKDKETVLIHAGGSGVGTAAIQLARQLADAHILTTAGSSQKLDFCKSLGADTTINYKEQDFDKEVLAATDQYGAAVILDFIGASYYRKNLNSIQTDGRWILIGLLGGAHLENINLMELMSKRVQWKATLLTPRSDHYKAELTADFAGRALPLFEQNKLKPIIDKVFPMEEVQDAHRRMESNQNIGKIILKMDESD